MKKLFPLFFLLIFSFSFVSAVSTNVFFSGSESGNLTFVSNENKTLDLSVYRSSTFISAFLNLSGFETGWGYSGFNYDVNPEFTYTEGMYFNGSRWFVIGISGFIDTYVYEYFSNWTYTGVSHHLSQGMDMPTALSFNGVNWVIVDIGDGSVYEYFSNWTYNGVSSSISEVTWPEGICWKEPYWYVGGEYSSDGVSVYFSNWTYVGVTYNVSSEDVYLRDIFWDGTNWWMIGAENLELFQYDSSWNYLNVSYNFTGQDTDPVGIFYNGTNWFMLGDDNYKVFQYENSFLENLFLEVGSPDGVYEWNFTEVFNSSDSPDEVSDFSSVLNSVLNGGICDCVGCFLDGDNCVIPFVFHSDSGGILEYSDVSILYDSGLGSVGIPFLGGGGGVLEEWNPIVYPEISKAFELFFIGNTLDTFLKRTWDVFRLSIAFILRQPGYLGQVPLEEDV